MKWFKHDTDASIDAKLQELLLDYGAVGYGMYWYCVELIAREVTPKNITFELEHDARIIARNLNLTPKEATNIMKRMVELGLFDLSNNERLRCVKLAYRLDDSLRKSVNTDNIIKKFRENTETVGIIPTNPEKVHSEEKRREEKRRDIHKTFSFSLSTQKLLSSTSKEYKEKLKDYILKNGKSMSYEDFHNQCEMKPYKYKNFKMAYDSWNKAEIKQETPNAVKGWK